jgi:TRAP-type mannitol/chloroaromatic compound transport system permease small subunit
MSPAPLIEPLGFVGTVVMGAFAPFLLLPLLTAVLGEPAARVQRPVNLLAEDLAALLGGFARACLLVLALGMLFTVALRYVFGESWTRLNEAVMYAHALGFLAAAPAALIGNAHVRVDVVYDRLSAKAKAAVDLFGFCVFLAPLMLMLLVYSGPVVELAWRVGERSPETDGLPFVWALKTAIPLFALAVLAAGVAHAGRAALRLRGLPGGEAPWSAAEDGQHTHAGAAP